MRRVAGFEKMRRGSFASFFFLSLLTLSFVAGMPMVPISSPASHGVQGQVAKGPNLVVISTSTTTVTRTVNVTTTPPGPVIAVHVVNQFGVWYQGAIVEVAMQFADLSYNTVASGTTVNGVYYATGLTADSTYLVTVYTSTGGKANQTVSITQAGASLTFTIPAPVPPEMSLVDVTLTPSALGGAFVLNATIANTSNATAYNTQLSVVPPPQLSLVKTGSVITIGTLQAGATKPISLGMTITTAAVTAGYSLGYIINYSDFTGTQYSASGNVSLPTPPPPLVVVQNVVLSPSVIQPGAYFTVTASVSNPSNSTAYNVQLALSPPADISLLNTGSVIPVGNLAPGASKLISLSMTVSSAAATTGYSVSFGTTFTDYFLNKFTGSGNIFIPVTGSGVHPNIVITSASFSSQSIHPGDTFSVPMSFENIGPTPANEVLLSVNATSPLQIVGSAGAYRLGTVAGNANTSLTLQFASPSSAPLGSYPIILTITYLDSYGGIYTTHQSLTATLIGAPSLVLNSLRFKNNPLSPGLQTFLSAELVNVGGDSALNVKIAFKDGPSFLSNTTMYLGSITPNGTGNGTAYLQVPSDLPVGDYSFSAVVSYTDPSGNSYLINSPYSVTIAPYSPPQVSVTNTLLSPAVLSPGAQGTFTIYLKNDGDNPAQNLTLSLDDNGQLFSSSYFGMGTLDALTSGTTVVGVNVNPSLKGGQYIVHISLSYYDDTGTHYSSTFPIEITVYGSTSALTVTNVGIGAGIVVVGALAFIFFRKAKLPSL